MISSVMTYDIQLFKVANSGRYYGCIGHPECDFMSWQKPTAENAASVAVTQTE